MADWRQIQARIRKAKTSSDPPAQLAELYERTRDAMVAFELAQWHEKAGNASETVQWYTTAAQRFRRAQWRTKAEEALTRLGAPIPEAGQGPASEHASEAGSAFPAGAGQALQETSPAYESPMEAESAERHAGNGRETPAPAGPFETQGEADSAEESGASSAAAGAAGSGKRRRRGRRGGRKRRGRGAAAEHAAPQPAPARASFQARPASGAAEGSGGRAISSEPESHFEERRAGAPFDVEASGRTAAVAWQGGAGGLVSSRSRAGDPGLSSRIAQLESQLRRLLACPLASLDDADSAPAGPGVLLLSDSDQVTHYYVEACQTLRIGIGNLLRGGRGSKGGAQLKPSLAEHLGINESKVAKYMKDHCAVRWIQLDEGAAELAHFATAVLRPVVAE